MDIICFINGDVARSGGTGPRNLNAINSANMSLGLLCIVNCRVLVWLKPHNTASVGVDVECEDKPVLPGQS